MAIERSFPAGVSASSRCTRSERKPWTNA